MENNADIRRPAARISGIDLLRGIVIMLMALDHTRDFWGMTAFAPEDPDASSAGWFFTRWITHFCAPVFIFLSGTSAWLYGQKTGDRNKLAFFLFTRGIWLILAEALLVFPGWTFTFPWQSGYFMLQVIWVLGWSMIILAGIIYLDWKIILGISLLAVGAHNYFDRTPLEAELSSPLEKFLHLGFTSIILLKTPALEGIVVYPLVPWFALMSLGYVCGMLYSCEAAQRKKIFLFGGSLLLFLFFLLRSLDGYGDANHWQKHSNSTSTLLDYLDISKYPPSLLYVCVTIGVTLIALALVENPKGKWAQIIITYGQVPFFFYLIHTPLINLSARIYHYFRYGKAFTFVGSHEPWPADYRPQLWLVYLVWVLLLCILYFLCRWYGNYRKTHNYPWLKYL